MHSPRDGTTSRLSMRLVVGLALSVTTLALLSSAARPGAAPRSRPVAGLATRPLGVAVAYPGPGWQTVSPHSSLTFRGVPVSRLGVVRVVGSRTGVHGGRLTGSVSGVGASFDPEEPFAPGERVMVTTGVRVMGASSTTYAFSIARPVLGAPSLPPEPPEQRGGGVRARRTWASGHLGSCVPVRPRYRSRPGLHPEGACVTRPARGTAPGLLLTTPHPTTFRQHGPTIYDNRGNVVWYRPMPYWRTWDLSVVTYHGQRLLAVYTQRPRGTRWPGQAQYLLLDRHYHVVARVRARNGYTADLHELQVTPTGHAFLGAYQAVRDPVSGRRTYEYVIQEIDIATKELLFEWHSLDHVPTASTYKPVPKDGKPWDYFHGNAIEPMPGGDLLVSARNTSTIYRLARGTGDVVWRLGGKRDDFGLVAAHPAWRFCFQHDVRRVADGELSVFDNGGAGSGCPRHVARMELFGYDDTAMTISRRLVVSSRSVSSGGYYTGKVGSARLLLNADWIVSWGDARHITEVAPGGRMKLDLTLSMFTYRTVRARWTADPLTRPAVAVQRSGSAVTAWVSWNGATRVSSWRVVAGADDSHLHSTGAPVRRHGFETRLRVTTSAPFIAVRAYDAQGQLLGTSRVVRPG